jgi:phytanoyl-CoA hydroxylase
MPHAAPADTRAGALARAQRADWERDGFLILPGFFDDAVVGSVNALVNSLADPRTRPPELARRIVVDPLSGPLKDQRLRLADIPAGALDGPAKYNDLYLESDVVRACSLHPRLVPILTDLLDGAPAICNSLNFIQGSQQTDHIDSWFMPPAVADKMVVTSVCLEDVHPDAGPLFYYPGSHKIPPYRFSDGRLNAIEAEMAKCMEYVDQEIAARGLKRQTFIGRKGDVFIWASQLAHGGTPINDATRTRRSLVTHYWRADDIPRYKLERYGPGAFYIAREHQPIPSSPAWQRSAARARQIFLWGYRFVSGAGAARQR